MIKYIDKVQCQIVNTMLNQAGKKEDNIETKLTTKQPKQSQLTKLLNYISFPKLYFFLESRKYFESISCQTLFPLQHILPVNGSLSYDFIFHCVAKHLGPHPMLAPFLFYCHPTILQNICHIIIYKLFLNMIINIHHLNVIVTGPLAIKHPLSHPYSTIISSAKFFYQMNTFNHFQPKQQMNTFNHFQAQIFHFYFFCKNL